MDVTTNDAKTGDKVKLGPGHPKDGARGEVTHVVGELCSLRLDDGTHIRVSFRDLRNFSSAARKAWKVMPSRQVGRPRGTKKTDRISVTLRLDRKLWQGFLRLEKEGGISNRTEFFNQILSNTMEAQSRTEHA